MGIFSPRIKVAVLRGGPSEGYEHSLKSGAHVLKVLRELPENYEPLDIFISRDGEWHREGLVESPEQALRHVDVAWNALHGRYGEDGQIQRILESLKVPYTGSDALPASLSYNKHLTKEIYRKHSLLTPEFEVFTEEDLTDEKLIKVFRELLHPVVIKPVLGTHSIGVRRAHSFNEVKEAVREVLKESPKVIVEEEVRGMEIVSTVIEKAKNERLYTLIPTGGRISEENKKISEMSRIAHEALGLRHYSSSDFIITPKGRIYILETNALPTLHEDSHLHSSLKNTGWKPKELIEHCINLALGKI